MPLSTTAAVTARDSFVIDIDRQALVERLAAFRDLRIGDDEIRRRFFNNSRSAKYPPGDTRGWKLPAARRRLAAEPDWQRHIRTCWYRPGDRRWIFWTPWMIDWPRQEMMRHMHAGNVALVCRRQMLRGQPCNFFWVADDIVIDGYIRSDNRGSESVFPSACGIGLQTCSTQNFQPPPIHAGILVRRRNKAKREIHTRPRRTATQPAIPRPRPAPLHLRHLPLPSLPPALRRTTAHRLPAISPAAIAGDFLEARDHTAKSWFAYTCCRAKSLMSTPTAKGQ